jgi:predicted DNA-binding protein (MmcQ/YjbR family)
MDVDSIRAYCLSFASTTEKLQWGDALCFKVGEKMFAVLGLDKVRLTFKCSPETFADLIERPDIHPSPYLGRHNWVMLDRLDALPNSELRTLIQQSCEIVAAKASSRARKSKAVKKSRPRARISNRRSRPKS